MGFRENGHTHGGVSVGTSKAGNLKIRAATMINVTIPSCLEILDRLQVYGYAFDNLSPETEIVYDTCGLPEFYFLETSIARYNLRIAFVSLQISWTVSLSSSSFSHRFRFYPTYQCCPHNTYPVLADTLASSETGSKLVKSNARDSNDKQCFPISARIKRLPVDPRRRHADDIPFWLNPFTFVLPTMHAFNTLERKLKKKWFEDGWTKALEPLTRGSDQSFGDEAIDRAEVLRWAISDSTLAWTGSQPNYGRFHCLRTISCYPCNLVNFADEARYPVSVGASRREDKTRRATLSWEEYTKGEDRETDKSWSKTKMKALELRVPHYRSSNVFGLRVGRAPLTHIIVCHRLNLIHDRCPPYLIGE
ncbi:hypothetical protein HZH66_010106 [Vespula vulgaris]|uniref:Uncharacterized protein n=1 Tax=Vespula vulgaris TaxID=7454 RepID=A0A834MZ10_VESVU|nr:hypothetical protein HZH66_010106 [Vespula vulgaris]